MISCKIFIWLANYMRQRLDKCRNTERERKAQRERAHRGERQRQRERERGKGSAVNACGVFKK